MTFGTFVQLRPMLFKFWDSGTFHQVGIITVLIYPCANSLKLSMLSSSIAVVGLVVVETFVLCSVTSRLNRRRELSC